MPKKKAAAKALRCGFVSIIGRPNVGKSTLLNRIVGEKVAIVSPVPQTTRTAIQGVLTLPEAQIVFVDTPGIHKADSPINKRMMGAVRNALEGRDLLLLVVDAKQRIGEEDIQAVDLARKPNVPVVLVLNKIDLIADKRRLLPILDRYRSIHEFADYVPVSALKEDGLDILRRVIVGYLPEGPEYFPEDYVTDQPERFLAAELVREKALLLTRAEVPHSIAVIVDRWEAGPKITKIYATIRVERDGQKAILIGAGGGTLKNIGSQARLEMEQLFGMKIYLDLHVRVQPGWREKRAFLDAMDWRTMAGDEDDS